MPDWSYHVIFKPILNNLSPVTSREFIHKGMNRIASLPFGPHVINFLGREESSPSLSRHIDGLTLSNPVGLSGKIDPFLSGTQAFSNLGFGFLEVGPVSLKGTTNPAVPLVDYEGQQIRFPDGESIGVKSVTERLGSIKKKQPVFIRLTGTDQEMQTMAEELQETADAFIVDNSFGLLRSEKPIYLSVSEPSEINFDELQDFSGIVLEFGEQYNPDNFIKVKQLRANGYSKTILTSGSICEPQDALHLLDAGADSVMLSGGYVFSGPGLTKRIKEALVSREAPPPLQPGWFAYWLFGLFILLGGVLALVFSITSIILPYDELFLGMKKEEIWAYNKRIMLFMAHDRMTLAGTMISGGIVYMNLAKHGVRNQLRWAKQAIDTAAIVGFLGIFAFIGYGYFDWLHLLFWIVLLPFYIVGFIKTRGIRGTPSSKNRRNHRIWKASLLGQFLFVLLGFSFVLGGIKIGRASCRERVSTSV